MAVILAAIAALAPLLILPGLSFYYDVTPKVAALLLPLAAGILWFALRGRPLLVSPLPSVNWLPVLLALQLLSLALSTALSAYPDLSLTGSNWRRFGLLSQGAVILFTFVTVCVARDPARLRLLLRVICGSGCLIAGYGIVQYFGVDPLLPAGSYHVGEGIWTIVRPPGTLGHASYFATYCGYVTFAGLALATAEKQPWWKLAGAAAAVLGVCAVVLSGTRAAMLGLLAGGAFLAFCFRPRLRRVVVAGAAAIALFAGFYYSPYGLKLRGRTRWFIEDPRGGARLLLWRDSARMVSHSWAWGRGPETFAIEFPQSQSDELARAYPDFYHESPHNMFLDAAAGQGAPGVILLLLLTALGFKAAWSARKREPALSATLGGSLAAGVVSQQFTAFTLPTALFFYVNLALLAALSWPAGSGGTAPRWARIAAVPVAFVLCWYAVRLCAYDLALARVDREIRAGALSRAIRDYEGARMSAPAGAAADLWYSRALAASLGRAPGITARVQAAQAALEAGIRATSTAEDRQNAFYNLAALYAGRNDLYNTEQALRGAIRAAPAWFKPHWMLARVLQLSGRTTEARREAAFASHLDGGKHPEVTQTLLGLGGAHPSSR